MSNNAHASVKVKWTAEINYSTKRLGYIHMLGITWLLAILQQRSCFDEAVYMNCVIL